MEEFDRKWKTFSERSTCRFFWFSDLSRLLNARRRDWNVNGIFAKKKFGECSFCWIKVSSTRWRKLGQDFFQRKTVLFVYSKRIGEITHFDVFAQMKIAYSDALDHFQQEPDLFVIFACWTMELQLGFCNRILADDQMIPFSRQEFIHDASFWEKNLVVPLDT